MYEAIANGKDIVTANKALLAENLPEILGMVESSGVTLGGLACGSGGRPGQVSRRQCAGAFRSSRHSRMRCWPTKSPR